MPSTKQRLIDLLAMGRVANVPTVLCNVFTGCLLGAWFWGGIDQELYPGYRISLLYPLLSGACLYLGGCFLNDWHDAKWDLANRPERAIPSGRFQPRTVLSLATVFLAAGLTLAFLAQAWPLVPAAVIVAAIVIYTRFHKQSALSIIPMGLCRGLLYVLGFLSQSIPPIDEFGGVFDDMDPGAEWILVDYALAVQHLLSMSVGLLAYIAGLSLAARFESRGQLIGNAKLLALALLFAPLLTHTWMWLPYYLVPSLSAVAVFALVLVPVITLIRRKGLGLFVSSLLAVIPLVDLLILLPISQSAGDSPTIPPALIVAAPCAAILFSLALQRLAPAT